MFSLKSPQFTFHLHRDILIRTKLNNNNNNNNNNKRRREGVRIPVKNIFVPRSKEGPAKHI
jgi:hypothetical protein